MIHETSTDTPTQYLCGSLVAVSVLIRGYFLCVFEFLCTCVCEFKLVLALSVRSDACMCLFSVFRVCVSVAAAEGIIQEEGEIDDRLVIEAILPGDSWGGT